MNRTVIITLVSLGVIALLVVGYYIFKPGSHAGDRTKLERTFTATEQQLIDTRSITPEELATHGSGSAEPWIAIDGVVYDVTGRWKEGTHHGLSAGTDVTEQFVQAGHPRATLQSLKVVGRYVPAG